MLLSRSRVPTMLPQPTMTIRRRTPLPRVAAAVLLSALVIAASAVAGTLLLDTSPGHPRRWDRRLGELVSFVEIHRGHRFTHPVAVYFLSAKDYRRAIGASGHAEPTRQEREEAERDAAELRALGLIEGDPDLLAARDDLADGGTLAFYDHERDVVNVRGSDLTPALRVTLVHELTHALQDQLFDLAWMLGQSSEAAAAARGVLEGDATAVENAYVESLDPQERSAFESESDSQVGDAEAQLDAVPDVLTTMFGLPYALGPSFVDLVNAGIGGPRLDRIDRVYRRLPASTAELFDPSAYFDDEDPVEVKPDRMPEATDVETDTLGAGALFVMLAERIDAAAAMAAVDGWLGDSYRSGLVKQDGRTLACVEVKIRVERSSDVAELVDSLLEWQLGMPDQERVSVWSESRQQLAGFRSCDPGPDVTIGVTGNSREALALPVARTQIAAGQINLGIPRSQAMCVGREVVAQLRPEDLRSDGVTDDLRDRVAGFIADAVANC